MKQALLFSTGGGMNSLRFAFATLSLLTLTLSTLAQSPKPSPAGSDWSRVQHLAAGTAVHVRKKPPAPHTTIFPRIDFDCLFVSASDDELVCTSSNKILFFPVHQELHIAHPDIATVRLTRRDRSALVGEAIGVGAGLGFTALAGVTNSEPGHSEDALAYTLFAILGGAIGYGIGHATDFMGGPTIYRAP
jgi:hypothetical protein